MDTTATQPAARRGVLFPDAYLWFVLVSSLDLMLTWLVLQLGGREVNPVAAWVLGVGGFWGMIVFKFSAVMLVVGACEYIGREVTHQIKARTLARAAVAISAAAPGWALIQLMLAVI